MKNLLYVIALASASFVAQAAPISDLHSTGDGFGAGVKDLNYTVTDTEGVTDNGYASDINSDYPTSGPWIPNEDSTASVWLTIAENPNAEFPIGSYLWRTTFDLTGFDVASASFAGRFAADDSAMAFLNGFLIGTSDGYSEWSSFSSLPEYLVVGLNVLDFAVYNGGGPSGLRAEMTNSTETATAAVPEPETYALMLAGLGVLGFIARRNKSE